MFGLIGDVLNLTAKTVGTIAGIAIAPIAISLKVSENLVREAIKAGCRTEKEIEKWIEENT